MTIVWVVIIFVHMQHVYLSSHVVSISQAYTSHLVPSMGPIVSAMTLHGQKICSRKSDQSGNGTIHG